MTENGLDEVFTLLNKPKRMPVLFIGHGNPMNAIEDNQFSITWNTLGQHLPKPEAILCISAHWETWGSAVTAQEEPRTIHDFGGFPIELYQVQYPVKGSLQLAQKVQKLIHKTEVSLNEDWGLDHGSWSVLMRMFPKADIPVVQLSLDYTKPADLHFGLGTELAALREEGVLILGSGNMVHNLRLVKLISDDFNQAFGFDWAEEARSVMMNLIREERYGDLINYQSISEAIRLAVPTPEHYLPLLYALAAKDRDDRIAFFNDQILAGSVAMTSLVIA